VSAARPPDPSRAGWIGRLRRGLSPGAGSAGGPAGGPRPPRFSPAAPGAAMALQFDRRLANLKARGWHRDPLWIGIACSVLLHVTVMALRFTPPAPIRFSPYDSQIEVVLLNAQTDAKPLKPEVLAQVNMEGGGDRDRGRARSPLPAESKVEDGDQLMRQKQRVAQLEEEQRKLLALARGPQTYVEPDKKPTEAQTPPLVGLEEQDVNQVIARLQAQIDRQISDYNKRPKRLTFGINAVGVSYARYVDDWAQKIERLGTERYPREARGRMYDSLICTVEIDKHGNVVGVTVNKRSKYEVLNRAVKQIVLAGAPYARFPPEMAREGDILQIVRTWTFTNDTLATTAVVPGK
jgi:protein TonB